MRRGLIAGVSGLLGRAIALRMARDGWTVSGVCRGPGEFGSAEALAVALPGVDIRFGDLADADVSREAATGVDAIVFAAGNSGVAASFADPIGDITGSALPWLQLLAAAQPATRIVLLSSQLVYGSPTATPFVESDRPRPASPYAVHRVLLEEHGRLFASRRGLDVTSLRLGNVFGDVIDICAPRTHGVVSIMLADLIRDGVARVYGDGSQKLELLHVDDLASAVGLMLATPPEGGAFSIFNLQGEGVSVRDIAEALRNGLGRGRIECVPWDLAVRDSVARDLHLNGAAFSNQFDWRPTTAIVEELRAIGRRWRES